MSNSLLKNQQLLLMLVMSLFTLFASPSYADRGTENSYLARINQVLSSLKPLINKAEQGANKNDRLKFQYAWLRSDIAKMQKGIQQKINETGIEPRPIQPIKGDYLVLNSIRNAP